MRPPAVNPKKYRKYASGSASHGRRGGFHGIFLIIDAKMVKAPKVRHATRYSKTANGRQFGHPPAPQRRRRHRPRHHSSRNPARDRRYSPHGKPRYSDGAQDLAARDRAGRDGAPL